MDGGGGAAATTKTETAAATAATSTTTPQEKGGWKACIECLLANEAESAKFSFKHLEGHAEELADALATNTSVRFLDLSCNSFAPVRPSCREAPCAQ
jgi:hypothetical protein